MREAFVSDLVAEVLGPRGGSRETLLDSPLDEYISGVLAPIAGADAPPEVDIDAAAELPSEENIRGEEDDAPEPEVTPPPIFSPVLNPQHRPHSMGLTFFAEFTGERPRLDICITWARYETEGQGWVRVPRFSILSSVSGSRSVYWLDSNGQSASPSSAEISFHALVRPHNPGRSLVSLYIVNRIALAAGDRPDATQHLFQPQIRVWCANGTRIVPGLEGVPRDAEERTLQFLYRDRPVLARGHLCSAVWRGIDPESSANRPNELDVETAAHIPPFAWGDAEVIPVADRDRFVCPDVRSEFVPMFQVGAPSLEWRSEYGEPPELRADELAELWDPANLQARLDPLVVGYLRWIDELRQRRTALHHLDQSIADTLIGTCQRTAARIRLGIELLARDEDVRLAFCFSMKVMALQSSWPAESARQPLTWRSFQLGFILMALESIVNPNSDDRDVCDLLWVPTGGGKTEAYLALAAFSIAFRRRRGLVRQMGDRTGAGVSVISRYTLRLLTIQQFRRAVKMITAAEFLRVDGLAARERIGWRPAACRNDVNFLWGSTRFSAGLWVGGSVTPNKLLDAWGGNQSIPGALSALRGQPSEGGEPAQILKCPACETILSVPSRNDGGLPPSVHTLHLIVRRPPGSPIQTSDLSFQSIRPSEATLNPTGRNGFTVLTVRIPATQQIFAEEIDGWWAHVRRTHPDLQLASARASRPGYFIRQYTKQDGLPRDYDFEIYCPSPQCPLHRPWCEGAPLGWVCGSTPHPNSPSRVPAIPALPDGARFCQVNDAFRETSNFCAERIPIPAWTVDDQIYHRCPSVVIATVDKFARPAFEPRASGIFGNVEEYHCLWGYYREGQHPSGDVGGHPGPAGRGAALNHISVSALDAPDLLLQDELHLIEGPLGSLVGLYETAVDFLCSEISRRPVKYIASTATVRQAEEQVQSVFNRRLLSFPPSGLTVDDKFFLQFVRQHPLNDHGAGQLYLGVCAPGRGPLTPAIRLWSRMLSTCWRHQTHPRIDAFWTLAGYFNAIRELAGARALYRQDIPERLRRISGANARPLPDENCQELSSRTSSTELPVILDLLSEQRGQDALFTTSMFGTGVDIPRLGLMLVHGQPKTTSSYIQATGRVGRRQGALAAVFLRAARPRDLNHYEFFCGYHQQLHRFVEPITVMPFAPGALDRACGPVAVFMLRNRRNGAIRWYQDNTAAGMSAARSRNAEVRMLPGEIENRSQTQPASRRPEPEYARRVCDAELDQWQQVASRTRGALRYVEYAIANPASFPVVLGDPPHQHRGLEVVYENAPQSLREIEESCGFET